MALSLLAQMPEVDVASDVVTFNAGISACEKGSTWKTALYLLLGHSLIKEFGNPNLSQ